MQGSKGGECWECDPGQAPPAAIFSDAKNVEVIWGRVKKKSSTTSFASILAPPESLDYSPSYLSHSTLLFKNALSGNWKKVEACATKLHDDENDIFELCPRCIYRHEITIESDESPADYKSHGEHLCLAKLHVFVEKIQETQAKNICVRALIKNTWAIRHDKWWYGPDAEAVRILYRGTAEGSLVRKLLFDMYAHAAGNERNANDHDLPREFLYNLLMELTRIR